MSERRTAWRSERRAQLAPEARQLAERLARAGLRFGVALAPVRQQHLLEQSGFALGERAVHAEVPGLDAVPHEARRRPARSRARPRRRARGRATCAPASTSPYSSSWPSSSSVMPAAGRELGAGEDHCGLREPVVVGTFGVAHGRRGLARVVCLGGAAGHLEERLGRGRLASTRSRRGGLGFGGRAPARRTSRRARPGRAGRAVP